MAYQFNGTSQGASVALNISAYAIVTLSFWAWINAYANSDQIFLEYTPNSTSANSGFLVDPDSSVASHTFEIATTFNTSTYWDDTFPRASAAAWHHYAIVFNRTTPVNVSYTDGTLNTLTTNSHTESAGTSFANSSLYFMSRDVSSLWCAGIMAECAIYNTTLTSGQVSTLAAGTSALNVLSGNLIGYWTMLTSGVDTSGAGNNLVLTGAPTIVSGPAWTLGSPTVPIYWVV